MRKEIIQVAGNPAFTRPNLVKTRIINPATNTDCFGTFPEIPSSPVCESFPSGPIQLHHGLHRKAHDGYGLVHMWTEHFNQAPTLGDGTALVIAYIQSVLQPQATIHYEDRTGRRADRTTVFRSPHGLLIVELGYDGYGNPRYSIITGIPSANAKGPVIGAF